MDPRFRHMPRASSPSAPGTPANGGALRNVPGAQDAMHVRDTGNVYYNELLYQLDPREVARIEAWAASVGQTLNWNLPLESKVHAQTIGPFTFTGQNPDSRRQKFIFKLPFAAYIKRFSGRHLAMVIAQAGEPSNVFASSPACMPGDYVDIRIRRQNSNAYTLSDDEDFVPWSTMVGDGKEPYVTDLVLFAFKGEDFIVDVRYSDFVETVGRSTLTLHHLQLPAGMSVG